MAMREHGGSLDRVMQRFGRGNVADWIDLSTQGSTGALSGR